MLDDGEDSSHGATQVSRVKGHGDVGREGVTMEGRGKVRREAFNVVMEGGSFFEFR